MQVPHAVFQPAEKPETQTLFGFDAVVIAPRACPSPPACFDPLEVVGMRHAMLPALEMERQRRTVGEDGGDLEDVRSVEREWAMKYGMRSAECGIRGVGDRGSGVGSRTMQSTTAFGT